MKVSIIMPVYNGGKYIGKSLQSILDQSYTNYEIIVIDDGSTDDTQDILTKLEQQDCRIKVIHQENSGKPSIARNVGLKRATGDLIMFLDSDDLYLQDRILNIVAIFKYDSDCEVCLNALDICDPLGNVTINNYQRSINFVAGSGCAELIENNRYLLNSKLYAYMCNSPSVIATSTISFRRELLDEIDEWFPEDMLAGEDLDFWFRCTMNRKIIFLDESLSQYIKRDDSLTSNSQIELIGYVETHQRNYKRASSTLNRDEINRYKCRLFDGYLNLAHNYSQSHDFDKSKWCYSQAYSLKQDLKLLYRYSKLLIKESIFWIIK